MLREWQAFQRVAKAFAEGEVCLRVAGLAPAARALVVTELLAAHPRAAILVVRSMADAHRFTQDLKFYGAPVLEFPEREPRLWRGGHHREADAERAVIARRLGAGEPLVVVVTPGGLDTPLPAPTDFAARTLRIGVGDRLERELLLESFEAAGYERTETVVEVGQWSVRGGIVDVFAPSHPSPVRIEFFGDDVESIRRFDPTSQRSTDTLDELLVLPLGAAAEDTDGAGRLLDYVPAGAPAIIDAPALLDETVGRGARPPSAPRDPRRPAARRAGDAGRDRNRARARHAGGPALHRALRPAHRGARTLARRRVHGAPGGRGRAPGRAPAPDPARQQRRGAHRGVPRGPRIPGDRGGRVLGGDRDLGGGPGAAHRGGDLRGPPPHATPAEVPAGCGPHGLHRPRGRRPGRPRGSRHRPLPRAAHDVGR